MENTKFNKNNRYLIFDGEKFRNFKGVRKTERSDLIKLVLSDNSSITATPEHQFLKSNGEFISLNEVSKGTIFYDGIRVVSKMLVNAPKSVFDAIEVEDSKSYKTNSLISHNCSFVGSSNTLIDDKVIQDLKITEPIKKAGKLFYFALKEENHQYCIVVDVARGHGNDFTAFSVIDITSLPYRVVATFKDNTISPAIELPLLLDNVGKYFNKAIMAIENNDLGESVANTLWYEYEYDNLIWSKDGEITGKGALGYKTTRKLKTVGIENLKTLVENGQLIVNDSRIIEEMTVFVKHRNGSYGAQDKKINDDLMATLWGFGWLEKTRYFEDVTNINSISVISKPFAENIENYLPIGARIYGNESEEEYPRLSEDEIRLIRKS